MHATALRLCMITRLRFYPYFNETKTYRSPVSKKDYERLIKILSHCDIDFYPNENIKINNKGRNPILEIWYNDQKKIFNGCFPIGYLKLEDFIWEYMSLIEGFDVIRVRRK